MPQILERNNQPIASLIKLKETPDERLQRLISEHKGKLATSFEELLGLKTGQTQEEIQAEVDDFLQIREDWCKPLYERNFKMHKSSRSDAVNLAVRFTARKAAKSNFRRVSDG